MEMWFHDEHTDNVKLAIRVDYQVFSAQSEIQRIDVLESKRVWQNSCCRRRFDAHRKRRVYLS